MSFIYPWFLWALILLVIPVLIHLFHFRRFKTVYFTNVQFLKEVKEQTSVRSKVKHLLTLLLRMLCIAFLVFAFAQPYLSKDADPKEKMGTQLLSIFIDNSFSMSAESEDVPLLEKAKRRAEEIVGAYSNDDKIQILTADFEGRDQRLLSKEDALSRIRSIKKSYQVKDLKTVLNRQKQALKREDGNKELYLISDFQENICNVENYSDSIYQLTLIPLQAVQEQNISIDSAWFLSPVQALQQSNPMIVKLHNHGSSELSNIRMALEINGQNRPLSTFNIAPKTTLYDTIEVPVLKTGLQEGKITIGDYPIEFDNNYYFSFKVEEKLNILEIYDEAANSFLSASFKDNDYFKLQQVSVKQLDYSVFAKQNLVILDELKSVPSGLASELRSYVEQGGKLLIFPSKGAEMASYNRFLNNLKTNTYKTLVEQEIAVNYINFEEFIFNDVYLERKRNMKLPLTLTHYSMKKKASSEEEVLLRLKNGDSFISKYRRKKGILYLCSAPLNVESSDFVRNGEVFIPMLYRMAIANEQKEKIAFTIGKDDIIETENRVSESDIIYKVGNKQGEFIPEQRAMGSTMILAMNNQIAAAGIYNIILGEEEVLDKVAYNYDRTESALSFLKQEDLLQKMGTEVNVIEGSYSQDFSELVKSEKNGHTLWKYCLFLCLLFLALETVVLRLWKV